MEQTLQNDTKETSTEEKKPQAELPILPPRSERKVKLVLKDQTEITCQINPTLMWIKQKFKETVRRQQITNSKLAGIEERRKALHEELTKASSGNDSNAAEIEKKLESLYSEVAILEDRNRKMNYELAGLSVHFPIVKDKQVTKDDIAWEFCDESEVMQAQNFFLLP